MSRLYVYPISIAWSFGFSWLRRIECNQSEVKGRDSLASVLRERNKPKSSRAKERGRQEE